MARVFLFQRVALLPLLTTMASVVAVTNSAMKQQQKGTYTFAVVPKRINSPFWKAVQAGCETRARVLSVQYKSNITCLFTGPAEGGPETEANQLAILQALLLQRNPKIDGLALAVVEAPSATEIISEFLHQNIPTVTFDSDAINSQRLAYIGTNNQAMGKELGRVLLQVHPNGGMYGIVGAGSPNIRERMSGVRQVLKESGGGRWTEVSTSPKDCVGDPALAVQQMYELVSYHPNITAIIPVGAWPMLAQPRDMWMSFIDANPKVVTVVGDSLPEQIQLMNEGYANALVGQLPFEMGKMAIDKLLEVKLAQEQGLPLPFEDGHSFETSFLNVINIPQDLPPLVQDMNYIGQWSLFGYILAGIVMLLSTLFALWTYRNRHTRIVRASQPFFLCMICAGTFIMASTIIPLSVDDEKHSPRGCDVACMAAPWLISVGFVITFSALFSKTFRVNKVFRNPTGFQRIRVTEMDVLTPFGALFVANIVVLLCWTLINPLRFKRKAHSGTDNWNRVYKSFYGSCVSTNGGPGSNVYVILLVLINFSALLIACFQAYQARNIHVEFSESAYIVFCILCTLEAFLVGFPILILMDENPVSSFIVQSILIFFTSTATLLFIFVPKIVRAKDVRLRNQQLQRDNSVEQLRFQVVEVGLPVAATIRNSMFQQGSTAALQAQNAGMVVAATNGIRDNGVLFAPLPPRSSEPKSSTGSEGGGGEQHQQRDRHSSARSSDLSRPPSSITQTEPPDHHSDTSCSTTMPASADDNGSQEGNDYISEDGDAIRV